MCSTQQQSYFCLVGFLNFKYTYLSTGALSQLILSGVHVFNTVKLIFIVCHYFEQQ